MSDGSDKKNINSEHPDMKFALAAERIEEKLDKNWNLFISAVKSIEDSQRTTRDDVHTLCGRVGKLSVKTDIALGLGALALAAVAYIYFLVL